MNNEKDLREALLDHLPKEAILARYKRARGDELNSKFMSPESSAALVANAFGIFLDPAVSMPSPPGWNGPWKPTRILLEDEVRFPWRGGIHPWLDVVIETDTHLVGIESKRYEPFRCGKRSKTFSAAYARDVWGHEMEAFKKLRDQLLGSSGMFSSLDAVQLVKHAFALRSAGQRQHKLPVLLYVYAEPTAWANADRIPEERIRLHRFEIGQFASVVGGAEVDFQTCTYGDLVDGWLAAGDTALARHAEAMLQRFDLRRLHEIDQPQSA